MVTDDVETDVSWL